MQNTADFLHLSSTLRILAQTLIRIGNDFRLLSSGPKAGFAEIILPEVQAGSSIMPGKVNPSIVEMLTIVCFQVIGFDQAILHSSMAGQLELNVMLPLIAYDLIEQIRLLTAAIEVFSKKCVIGITANKKMCQYWFSQSSGIAAILNPYLGYDKTAALVKLSLRTNKPVKQLAIEKKYLSKEEMEKIFAPDLLTKPNLFSKS
jgi:aspartate ammonia-lyase